MQRVHLFEFEDQPWFPRVIRDCMTDYLRYVANSFDFYRSVVPVIARGLNESGGDTIVDLASGAGGGWKRLAEHLRIEFPDLQVVLTDLYPNDAGLAEMTAEPSSVFSLRTSPVDARDVPSDLKGLRSQFLSFHHFTPEDAKQILQNAVDAGQPIVIVEAQKRNVEHLIKFSFSPIAVLGMTPRIRPFKWSRILLTYVIPVVPLFTYWDGIVSVLRTYSTTELKEMTGSLRNRDSYAWDIGETKSGSVTVVYLLGFPK